MATAFIPFDDRDGFIWLDGAFQPWRDCRLHCLTHGLHYGSAVFEGLRVYGGNIFKLREHSERLIQGCKYMDMKIPYTLEDISAACLETVAQNKITDGYIRPLAWRGAQQMGVSAPLTKIHLAVAAWEWPSYYDAASREKGLSVKTTHWRRPPAECAPVHVKAAGLYMICTLAKSEAEAAGFDDALMLDYRGYVSELTSANLFFVRDGELHTPLPDNFLSGITRRTVIDLAKDAGIAVHERVILPDEIGQMQECFATGTAAEVCAIGRIDDHAFTVAPVTRQLRDAYEKLVRQP